MLPNKPAIEQSVREFRPANEYGAAVTSELFATSERRTGTLPPVGTRERDRMLRWYYRQEHNGLVQGAFAGFIKKIKSAPWAVEGDAKLNVYTARKPTYTKWVEAAEGIYRVNAVEHFQDVLQAAEFGSGWGNFLSMVLLDYLTQDFGAVIEVIGPGEPDQELTGAVTGLAHLDSGRCYATGNPEYPILYLSLETNTLHKMHSTRVIRLVDMPDPDERLFGSGQCALSRIIAVVNREILIGRYIESSLDDKPRPGIIVASGMTEAQRNLWTLSYNKEQSTDEQPVWGKTLWFYSVALDQKVEITPVSFSEPPEKFDFEKYVQIHVNAIALALGVDKQEVWELGNGALGSGAQSVILAQKAQGKAFGDIISSLERIFNTGVLPDKMTFTFKYRDSQADQTQAAIDSTLIQTATAMHGMVNAAGKGIFSDLEVRRYLANQSEAFHKLLTNAAGQVQASDDDRFESMQEVSANDDEVAQDIEEDATAPKTESEHANTAPVEDESEPAIPTPKSPSPLFKAMVKAATQSLVEATALIEVTPRWHDPLEPLLASAYKTYPTTRAEFVVNLTDLMTAGTQKDMDRRRFGIVFRAQLRRLGQQAYKDGMEAAGVNDDLTEDDLSQVQAWLGEQSAYIKGFADEVYTKGLSQAVIAQRAEMWANKSLQYIYDAGRITGDRNAMYEWRLDPAKKNCKDCTRLTGQRHRLKEWYVRGWQPQSERLECKGFLCGCKLYKTQEKAFGRF